MSFLSHLISVDGKCSEQAFLQNQSSRPVKLVTTIFNISSDEIIWFILVLLIQFVLYAYHLGLRMVDSSAYGQLLSADLTADVLTIKSVSLVLNDVFGAVSTSVMFEQILKRVFQRQRPTYRKQRQIGWAVLWEWYSFPSGHTMRTGFLYHFFTNSKVLALAFPQFHALTNASLVSQLLLGWVVLVGYSRVSAGKHYFLDVISGAVIGFLIGYYSEVVMDGYLFLILRAVAKISISIQYGLSMVHPELQKAGLGVAATVLLELIYIAFARTLVKDTFILANLIH